MQVAARQLGRFREVAPLDPAVHLEPGGVLGPVPLDFLQYDGWFAERRATQLHAESIPQYGGILRLGQPPGQLRPPGRGHPVHLLVRPALLRDLGVLHPAGLLHPAQHPIDLLMRSRPEVPDRPIEPPSQLIPGPGPLRQRNQNRVLQRHGRSLTMQLVALHLIAMRITRCFPGRGQQPGPGVGVGTGTRELGPGISGLRSPLGVPGRGTWVSGVVEGGLGQRLARLGEVSVGGQPGWLARWLRAAWVTVWWMRRARVSGRLARAIHSRIRRREDGGKARKCLSAEGLAASAVCRSAGTTWFCASARTSQVPVRLAWSTSSWPAGSIRPAAVRRSTRSRLTLLQVLRGFRGVKHWYVVRSSRLIVLLSIQPKHSACSTACLRLTPGP